MPDYPQDNDNEGEFRADFREWRAFVLSFSVNGYKFRRRSIGRKAINRSGFVLLPEIVIRLCDMALIDCRVR